MLTELTQDLPEALQAEITARTPLGRFGTTEEIANAVAFLASDEAALHHRPGARRRRRPGDDVGHAGSARLAAPSATRGLPAGLPRARTVEHGDEINVAAAAADADPARVATYARTLADAYGSFAEDLKAIAMPGSVRPAAEREVEAVEVLVGLAGELEAAPSDASIRAQLQEALARVARTSAELEALLGISN